MRLPSLTAVDSLGGRILRQMALRIAVVVVVATLASYWHVYRSVTASGLETLGQYVRERADRESQRFLLAEDNLRVLMGRFLAERKESLPGRGPADFARSFQRSPDGAVRRQPGFDPAREPSAYIARRVSVDAAVQREAMTMLHLVRDFGRAWSHRFASSFLASMDGMAATYLEGADWYRDIAPDQDFGEYPWVRMVLPQNDPERQPQWTSVWYDWVIERFAVTCILPADVDGRFRYYAGTSMLLDDIIRRAREVSLAGTSNLIFRADGKLVSHPDEEVMEAMRRSKGDFSIADSGNAHLQAIYRAARAVPGAGVVSLDAYDEYLGVARIAGPNWYFVSVLPKKVLSQPADSTAQMVLWLGLAALLMELAIVGWIIRRQVSRPLGHVMRRLAAFGQGQWDTRIDARGSDELARLGHAFNGMAQALQEDQRQLREHAASLEARIQERTRQLQDKDRAKTRFLAAASHDLRQPIQAAALFVDNLKRTQLDERQRRSVDHLQQSIESVRALLEGLLDISRMDAGAITPQSLPVSVQQLLVQLSTEFTAQARERNLLLRIRYPQPDILVRSDPQLLLMILRNLLANAVAYTSSGGVLVGVRRRGTRIALQVWDTGIGIAEGHLERIFEEFYQVANPQRDRSKGFGIGLAIARRASLLVGGHITCVSRPGRGTRFELVIDAGPQQLVLPAAPAGAARARVRPRHVMLVEDDQLVAEAFAGWLADEGCTVTRHAVAEEALRDPRLQEVEFFITDFRLPGAMDGLSFLDAVRQQAGRPIQAIVVTGDTSPDFIERAARSPWKVLYKPVDAAVLAAALQ